jgi:hypothetical protein
MVGKHDSQYFLKLAGRGGGGEGLLWTLSSQISDMDFFILIIWTCLRMTAPSPRLTGLQLTHLSQAQAVTPGASSFPSLTPALTPFELNWNQPSNVYCKYFSFHVYSC